MPQRSAVNQLPEATRKQLEQKLLKGGFSDYQGLADWLGEQGFEISRSAVHRFGQQFEQRLNALKIATDQAKAIAAAARDDEGDMNEALIRLVQTKTMNMLIELDQEAPDLAKLGRMSTDMVRASISQKKWNEQFRDKADAKFAELEAAAGSKDGKLDMATLKRVREEIYGLV